jgi:hypothetical protein
MFHTEIVCALRSSSYFYVYTAPQMLISEGRSHVGNAAALDLHDSINSLNTKDEHKPPNQQTDLCTFGYVDGFHIEL